MSEGGSNKATTTAMANLAEAIQGLVQHMRAEQQMIRDWADAQAELNGDIRRFMEILCARTPCTGRVDRRRSPWRLPAAAATAA